MTCKESKDIHWQEECHLPSKFASKNFRKSRDFNFAFARFKILSCNCFQTRRVCGVGVAGILLVRSPRQSHRSRLRPVLRWGPTCKKQRCAWYRTPLPQKKKYRAPVLEVETVAFEVHQEASRPAIRQAPPRRERIYVNLIEIYKCHQNWWIYCQFR